MSSHQNDEVFPDGGERTRKRKWDSALQPNETTGDENDNSKVSTEASIAAAVASTIPRRNVPPMVVEKPFEILEINDHPGRRHAMLSTNIRTIQARHGVVIVSKGRYIAPDQPSPSPDAPDHEKKLFLKIRGETMTSVQAAVNSLNDIMSKSDNPIARVWADMQIDLAYESFELVKRLMGPDREYIRFIEQETETQIEIRGLEQDSGNAHDQSQIQHERLHFLIKGQRDRLSNLNRAKGLVISLVRTVQPVYDDYRMRYFGIPPPRRGGGPSNRWLSRGGYQQQPSYRNSQPYHGNLDYGQGPPQPPDGNYPPPPPPPRSGNFDNGLVPPPPPPEIDAPPPPLSPPGMN